MAIFSSNIGNIRENILQNANISNSKSMIFLIKTTNIYQIQAQFSYIGPPVAPMRLHKANEDRKAVISHLSKPHGILQNIAKTSRFESVE
jgi:hypothetical protein